MNDKLGVVVDDDDAGDEGGIGIVGKKGILTRVSRQLILSCATVPLSRICIDDAWNFPDGALDGARIDERIDERAAGWTGRALRRAAALTRASREAPRDDMPEGDEGIETFTALSKLATLH
jgi:hypothetical protein